MKNCISVWGNCLAAAFVVVADLHIVAAGAGAVAAAVVAAVAFAVDASM